MASIREFLPVTTCVKKHDVTMNLLPRKPVMAVKQKKVPADYSEIKSFDLTKSISGLGQIRDIKTHDKLIVLYRGVKLLWEYTAGLQINAIPRKPDPDLLTMSICNFWMCLACTKLLRKDSRLNSDPRLLRDKGVIDSAFSRSLAELRMAYIDPAFKAAVDNFHPLFPKLMDLEFVSDRRKDLKSIGDFVGQDSYKKLDNGFIRTSNAEKGLIATALNECLTSIGKIYILRFDIYEKSKSLDFSKFRNELDQLISDMNGLSEKSLLKSVDVIYPRSSNFTVVNGLVGHLVLVFGSPISDQVGDKFPAIPFLDWNNSDLNLYLINSMSSDMFIKDRGNMRVLRRSNPSSFEILESIAEFMTIERRILKPAIQMNSITGEIQRYNSLRCKNYL